MMTDTKSRIAAEARRLTEIEAELNEVHGEPVAETANKTVFSDSSGYELNEIAEMIDGVTRQEVSQWMHEQARAVYGRDQSDGTGDPWGVSDPVVVLHDE